MKSVLARFSATALRSALILPLVIRLYSRLRAAPVPRAIGAATSAPTHTERHI